MDPIAFLSLPADDWEIACAVYERVLRVRNEDRMTEWKAVVKAIGDSVGHSVAKEFARLF